MRNKKAEAAN